jgi:hypothetical protein
MPVFGLIKSNNANFLELTSIEYELREFLVYGARAAKVQFCALYHLAGSLLKSR